MAGDWIPMRLDLREDPSVMQMAEIMGINETCIVGYCHAIWSWVSAQCPVDSVTHVTLLSLGRVTNTGRFPEAMARAGWVIEETLPDGTPLLRFPNFDRWLSNTAKKRLLDARRKKESRKNVREMSGLQADKSVTTGQERREQKSKDIQRPSAFTNVPPSVSDVSRRIAERNLTIDVEEFMAYYDARGWKLKGQMIKDWNACLTTWAKNGKHFSPVIQEENNDPIL